NDADNRRLLSSGTYALANGILVRPEVTRRRAADDDDRQTSLAVSVREGTTAQDGNAECAEIVGGHGLDVQHRIARDLLVALTRYREPAVDATAGTGKGHCEDRRDRLDSGQRFESRHHPVDACK